MNRLLSLILNDYPRKIVALILALTLYVGVSIKISEERSLTDVPIQVVLAPELSFAARPPQFVTIAVKGSRRALKEVTPEQFAGRVYINTVNRSADGTTVVYLRPDMFKSKPGVKVVRVPALKLHLQRKMSKRVQVKAQFSGRLSEEFRQAGVQSIPAEVMVSGPELTLNALEAVFTEPVPLSETVTDPFEYESKLIVPADLQVDPGKVMVQVDIAKNFEQRRFAGLPIRLMQNGGGRMQAFLFTPGQTADVVVSGLANRLLAVKPGSIRLFADLSDIRQPGTYVVPLRSSCSVEGVSVKAVTPGEVKVKVVKLP